MDNVLLILLLPDTLNIVHTISRCLSTIIAFWIVPIQPVSWFAASILSSCKIESSKVDVSYREMNFTGTRRGKQLFSWLPASKICREMNLMHSLSVIRNIVLRGFDLDPFMHFSKKNNTTFFFLDVPLSRVIFGFSVFFSSSSYYFVENFCFTAPSFRRNFFYGA